MLIEINQKKIEVECCRGFWNVFRGLMFSRRKNILLVLPREGRNRAAIHSFFVFFPFQAVFINSRNEVVDSKRMKPFRVFRPRKPASHVLEVGEKNFNLTDAGIPNLIIKSTRI
ncbi:MAG: DUF192 domain-containing protein [bacterium]|nr:DUF192 domain-containing protein [bacterium]